MTRISAEAPLRTPHAGQATMYLNSVPDLRNTVKWNDYLPLKAAKETRNTARLVAISNALHKCQYLRQRQLDDGRRAPKPRLRLLTVVSED